MLEQIHQHCISLFERAEVPFQRWQHEPILDFATDARLAEALGWQAAPTKSLFLRCRDGRHALLLTHRDSRLDSRRVKALLGSRPSLCSDEEMSEVTGCLPGAVCPFALPAHIPLLVDPALLSHDELMFTPGLPEWTFAFASTKLPTLLNALPNPVSWLPDDDQSGEAA